MSAAHRTLGVSPLATPDDIKSAYRKLALLHHPDRNPGDPHAAARMTQVNVAYEELTKAKPVLPGGIHVEIFDTDELRSALGRIFGSGLGVLIVDLFSALGAVKAAEARSAQGHRRSSKKKKSIARAARQNTQRLKRGPKRPSVKTSATRKVKRK